MHEMQIQSLSVQGFRVQRSVQAGSMLKHLALPPKASEWSCHAMWEPHVLVYPVWDYKLHLPWHTLVAKSGRNCADHVSLDWRINWWNLSLVATCRFNGWTLHTQSPSLYFGSKTVAKIILIKNKKWNQGYVYLSFEFLSRVLLSSPYPSAWSHASSGIQDNPHVQWPFSL